jgi:hypothetical protein
MDAGGGEEQPFQVVAVTPTGSALPAPRRRSAHSVRGNGRFPRASPAAGIPYSAAWRWRRRIAWRVRLCGLEALFHLNRVAGTLARGLGTFLHGCYQRTSLRLLAAGCWPNARFLFSGGRQKHSGMVSRGFLLRYAVLYVPLPCMYGRHWLRRCSRIARLLPFRIRCNAWRRFGGDGEGGRGRHATPPANPQLHCRGMQVVRLLIFTYASMLPSIANIPLSAAAGAGRRFLLLPLLLLRAHMCLPAHAPLYLFFMVCFALAVCVRLSCHGALLDGRGVRGSSVLCIS